MHRYPRHRGIDPASFRSAEPQADCEYGAHRITAAVRHARICGCQVHPEKSADAGLRILGAFLRA